MKSKVLLVALIFLAFACDTSEPPAGGEPSVQFSAVDASCTEVWLQVKLLPGVSQRAIRIQRDSTTILNTVVVASETLIVDEGLSPNTSYNYSLSLLIGLENQRINLIVSSLDTTSHDFVWQKDTLGDGGSSVLYDVAIINDTLVYAVGQMYKLDSLGNFDPRAYNLAKWTGQDWDLLRIPFVGPCSAIENPPITAIWAFAHNNILLTDGGSMVTYDGKNSTMDCRVNSLISGGLEKIFATSIENIYAVGRAGTIVHYSEGVWQRIESGTSLPINDVFGGVAPSGAPEIIAVASDVFNADYCQVLKITGNSVQQINTWGLPRSIRSLWFLPERRYYIIGDGMFQKNTLDSNRSWMAFWGGLISYYVNSVRANSSRDIVAVGAFGESVHFNGKSWRNLHSETGLSQGSYFSVAIKNDLVVAVGHVSNKGVVAVGRRGP